MPTQWDTSVLSDKNRILQSNTKANIFAYLLCLFGGHIYSLSW